MATAMRCAIYTRKSHDERAESQYGSIEAQRDLCAAYVASQAGEGWALQPERYDDEGWSGGTLRRPALSRLLAAVDAGEIDVVAVYKIDRLSRSLRDFLELVSRFEARGVTFVAITQSFSTTTSMGRLTLNVLLSFAQFERELTGERLRDWFAGARSRGLWANGPPPYGYRVEKLRLHIREDQAEVVRYMFRRYPALGSTRLLANELNARGNLNKRGRPFGQHAVATLLRNRLYRGDLTHMGEPLPGHHEPIVTEAAWSRVQSAIASSARRRAALQRPRTLGMLSGLLHGRHGGPMVHVFVHRPKRTFRYYVPSVDRYRSTGDRFRAADLETALTRILEPITGGLPTDEHQRTGTVRRLVERIDLDQTLMRIRLATGGELTTPHCGLIHRCPNKGKAAG